MSFIVNIINLYSFRSILCFINWVLFFHKMYIKIKKVSTTTCLLGVVKRDGANSFRFDYINLLIIISHDIYYRNNNKNKAFLSKKLHVANFFPKRHFKTDWPFTFIVIDFDGVPRGFYTGFTLHGEKYKY